MIDNDIIIQAYEACISHSCYVCPLNGVEDCRDKVEICIPKIYNRQKAEIERLGTATEEAVACYNRMESLYHIKCVELKVAKAEAIKAFAERLCEGRVSNDPAVIAAKCLLKEMTEGKTDGIAK